MPQISSLDNNGYSLTLNSNGVVTIPSGGDIQDELGNSVLRNSNYKRFIVAAASTGTRWNLLPSDAGSAVQVWNSDINLPTTAVAGDRFVFTNEANNNPYQTIYTTGIIYHGSFVSSVSSIQIMYGETLELTSQGGTNPEWDITGGSALVRITGVGTPSSLINNNFTLQLGTDGFLYLPYDAYADGNQGGVVYASTDVIIRPSQWNWIFSGGDGTLNLPASANNTAIIQSTVPITLTSNSHSLILDTSGNITFPDSTTYGSGTLASGYNHISLDNNYDTVTIQTGYNADIVGVQTFSWVFDRQGTITLPGGAAQLHSDSTDVFLYSDGFGSGSNGIVISTNNYTNISNQNAVIIQSNTGGTPTRWTFNNAGEITFPDGSYQHTAWAGGRVVSAPTSSTGASGDLQGDIAFDNNYMYYCVANYSVTSFVITQAVSTNSSPYIYAPIASCPTTPQAGWYIQGTLPGEPQLVIHSVTTSGSNYQLECYYNGYPINSSIPSGYNYTITPVAGNIWVKNAWGTTGSW